MDHEIIFRHLKGTDNPREWSGDMHWQVELYDSSMDYPMAIAFVSAHPNMKLTLGCTATLDFIFAIDQFRRC